MSTDIAPSMVEVARKRGAELGVSNVDYRVLDAQAMDLADASFDGIIARWVFMLMPDPAAGFRECRRVVKPGGHLAFAVFTGPEDNPFAALPSRVLREAGHLPPPSSEWQPGILALGPLVRALPDAARNAVRATIDARLASFTSAGGIVLPSRCWGGLAIRAA